MRAFWGATQRQQKEGLELGKKECDIIDAYCKEKNIEKIMIYCFDIDGTICSNTDGEYEDAKPFLEIIERVNRLFDEGNTIYFYTARGATTGKDWSEKTKSQLQKWSVKYHQVFFGKPTADIYIDDKAMSLKDWLTKATNG